MDPSSGPKRRSRIAVSESRIAQGARLVRLLRKGENSASPLRASSRRAVKEENLARINRRDDSRPAARGCPADVRQGDDGRAGGEQRTVRRGDHRLKAGVPAGPVCLPACLLPILEL